MSQVLSQKEVDALLSAVVDGDIPTETKQSASAAQDENIMTYDLTSQDKIVRGRMPTLDIVYERFVRAFRMTLSTQLRRLATLSIAATDTMKFGEFVNTLPMPSCMSVVRFETLRGSAIVVFESKLAYALIDCFLGGNAAAAFSKGDGKEFTGIEQSIIRKVVVAMLADLEKAWGPVTPMAISFTRMETNPQFVGIVPPSDIIISTTFTIELEHASGSMSVVIPFSTLEPIRQKLLSGFQQEVIESDDYWINMMIRHLMETELNIDVTLGQTEMSLRQILELKVGDVVPLRTDATATIPVEVEGVQRFSGLYGNARGSKAVQVTQVVENPNKEFLKRDDAEGDQQVHDDLF